MIICDEVFVQVLDINPINIHETTDYSLGALATIDLVITGFAVRHNLC